MLIDVFRMPSEFLFWFRLERAGTTCLFCHGSNELQKGPTQYQPNPHKEKQPAAKFGQNE